MNKTCMEAFSDGMISVIIAIIVLEMEALDGVTFAALKPLILIFIGYALSFVFVGLYWNNHHHLLQAIEKVNSKILWANLPLLLMLASIPEEIIRIALYELHY